MLLGLDIGSSSIKASLVEIDTGNALVTVQSPAEEMLISSPKPGWAEQEPEMWWKFVLEAIAKLNQQYKDKIRRVKAIGISYQMHGLVCVDNGGFPLRPSIIWCDSRAVEIGEKAFQTLGKDFCLRHYLNSPGNFTASKLRWVQLNEPSVYEKIHKIMLPGDFIAGKLTGEFCSTSTGLSEGVLWDYNHKSMAGDLMDHYKIEKNLLPKIAPVFSIQGRLSAEVSKITGMETGTPVAYRAGDQPNNAFSLNVLNPGETAATAGTSGVIYSVTDTNAFDHNSRVNTFIHVNDGEQVRNGVLLCINGTGILNRWLKDNFNTGNGLSYEEMNTRGAQAPIGAEGLLFYPFGNGAERIFENKNPGASLANLDLNRHRQAHVFRAAQEGIVFSMKYGFEILKSMDLKTDVVRAGLSNMFLSPLFREAFVNTLGVPLELYETNGAIGAAIGAGIGAGIYGNFKEAFKGLKILKGEEPAADKTSQYFQSYHSWKEKLHV